MLIDCDGCVMQHTDVCGGCVVTLLLREVGAPLELDDDQATALDNLADVGLVPPLRLVPRRDEGREAVG